MTAVPRALLIQAAGLTIQDSQTLGVGMLLLPQEETRAEGLVERCLHSHDFAVLGWRDVPVCTEFLGETALATMPKIPPGDSGRLVERTGDDGAQALSGAEAVRALA